MLNFRAAYLKNMFFLVLTAPFQLHWARKLRRTSANNGQLRFRPRYFTLFKIKIVFVVNLILAANTELVLINFYADWCRFSNMLAPIFDEAADKVAAEFTTPGKVVLGKVDCDKDSKSS